MYMCITAARASNAREEGMMGVVHGGEEMIDEPGQAQDSCSSKDAPYPLTFFILMKGSVFPRNRPLP